MPADPTIEILPPEGAVSEPLPQAGIPLVIDSRGNAWLPHATRPDMLVSAPVVRGVGMFWWPAVDDAGAFIAIFGGNPADPSDELVVTYISREGIRSLAADMLSIADQLGEG